MERWKNWKMEKQTKPWTCASKQKMRSAVIIKNQCGAKAVSLKKPCPSVPKYKNLWIKTITHKFMPRQQLQFYWTQSYGVTVFLFRHGLTRLFLKGTAWSARFFCFICYRLYYCIDTALSKWKDGKIERWKNKLSRELAQASRKCEAPW